MRLLTFLTGAAAIFEFRVDLINETDTLVLFWWRAGPVYVVGLSPMLVESLHFSKQVRAA